MTHKHLPAHLEGKTFDDPQVIEEFRAYMTDVMKRYGDYIDFFTIGNEIDIYLGMNPDDWPGYPAFFKAGAEVIKSLKPHIKIGVVTMAKSDSSKYWSALGPDCDFFGITYYVPCATLDGVPTSVGLSSAFPRYFAHEFERAIARAGDKPILIMEAGCPTQEAVQSKPEYQAQFIELLFEWLPKHDDQLAGLLWLNYQDWNFDKIKRDLDGQMLADLLADDSFVHYLSSLGLKDEQGNPKPGYAAFKDAMTVYRAGDLSQQSEIDQENKQ